MLDAFIKNWKLEAIYEDENGVEFFDEEALDKIRTSLAPKNDYQNFLYYRLVSLSIVYYYHNHTYNLYYNSS